MNPTYTSPIVDGGGKVVRAYKIWKGSNIFGLHGRLIFGPDARSILLTVPMIVVPVAVFCAFVARKLMDDFPHRLGILIMVFAVLLAVAVLIFLILTSARDPGIVPRSNQPPEMESFHEHSQGQAEQNSQTRYRRVKEVIINGMRVQVKYCETCMLYRPPRCSHCSICDNCVERFDHHCPWVGQCIGLRNYRFYFFFVSSATLLAVYVFAFCSVYVAKIMDGEKISVWKALAKTPASIVLMAYSFLLVWFVGGLTVFHSYLISTNQTTYENFRYHYERRANPYNKGVMGNFKEVFLSSIPPSKNNFRAKVEKMPDFPSRRVDGSFINSNLGEAIGDIEKGMKRVLGESGRLLDNGVGEVIDDFGSKKVSIFVDELGDMEQVSWAEAPEESDYDAEDAKDVDVHSTNGDGEKEDCESKMRGG